MLESGPPETDSESSLAAIFQEAGEPLELLRFPIPTPVAHEALVRIECCTVCGSDLHTISGKRKEPTPSILGHEILGVVERLGSPPLCDVSGTSLEVGDRVTWSTCISCGECARCLSGLPQKCHSIAKYGHDIAEGKYALSGGLADFILLREGSAIVKVDPALPAEVICPVNCATATVTAAYRVGGIIEGRRVLIFGAGMLGLTAAAFAKSNAAAHVTVCDTNAERLQLSRRFGADSTIEWSNNDEEFSERASACSVDGKFDLILELSGSSEAVETACRLGAIGASVVLVGSVMKSPMVSLDPESIVRRWLCIRGVHNYAPVDLLTAINFLSDSHSRFPFGELVEKTFSLTDVNQAIEFAQNAKPVRIAIRPGFHGNTDNS